MEFLFVNWNVDPVILHIGAFQLRWYSLLFLAGFVLGWYIFRWYFKREAIPLKLLDPLLVTLIVGTIVGARLGHCLFYEPEYYLANPIEILKVWKGGLASHGGTIALILAMWWFARKYGRVNGFDFLWIVDRLCIAVCFAGAFIRLGNLMNSEIYGCQTDLPWGFIFERNGETVPKHPTQLYEALSYVILGLGLLALYRFALTKIKRGTIFGLFLVVLFGMRFLIEFIKEDQVPFEQGMLLNMGQILSIPFIIGGLVLIVWSMIKGKPAGIVVPDDSRSRKDPPTHYAKPLNR